MAECLPSLFARRDCSLVHEALALLLLKDPVATDEVCSCLLNALLDELQRLGDE